jgi:serine phosphatase RsbU (regulator of sigma subunit)
MNPTEQIAQMEALYQTQKDGKVKLLEQEAEINELQLRKRATYLGAATAVTFLLGIMSLMAFFAYRSKSKINSILERKNHLIEAQKKEITDSIRYAENIQRALLPHADVLQAVFPDSFLFHRPKDIVSGDFYWIYDFPDRVYFAVVDCTGHGVPGAFMSFIGTSALNRAITDLGLITPSDILSSLSDQVSETLRSGQGADVKDGMDLALCCYFKQTGELHYAGAYNPLWVMRNGEMEIIRANKQPVGNMSSHSPFTNHILNVSAGDAVYLFSDGFADQFGGAHDKRIGSAKFRSTLLAMKTKSLKEQGIALAAYFDAWKGTAEQVDDVCVMGVRF